MSKHQSCSNCNRDFVGPDLNIGENTCPECSSNEDAEILEGYIALTDQLRTENQRLQHLAEVRQEINERLKEERDEYHDQYHLCEAKLLSHKSIIKQGQIAYERLIGLTRKVVLCFPDKIPEGQKKVAFNIPAYIIDELKEIVKDDEE